MAEAIKDTRTVILVFRYHANNMPLTTNDVAIRYVVSINGRCLKIPDGAIAGKKVSIKTTTGILMIIMTLLVRLVPALIITKDIIAIPDIKTVGRIT